MFACALLHVHVHLARWAFLVQVLEPFCFEASWKASRCTQLHLPKQVVLFQDSSTIVPLVHIGSWPVVEHKIASHDRDM
jgi:hypothetical protein